MKRKKSWLALGLGLYPQGTSAGGGGGGGGEPGTTTDTLIPWTPSMLSLNALYTVEDQTTILDTGGVQQVTPGGAIETWQDKSGNARHAVSAAANAGVSVVATRPLLGPVETLGSWTGSPLRFNVGVTTHRLITPASTYGMSSGGEGEKLFIIARSRPAGTGVRALLGSSAGGSLAHIATSSAAVNGQMYTGSTAGLIKTDTSTRIDMVVQQKDVNAGNAWVARLNGSEAPSPTGAGGSVASTARLVIGSLYGFASGADHDNFVVAVIPAGTSRTNIQRLEGYYAHLFGLTLAAGHPFAASPPMVPAGTTSTQAWSDANFATTVARQTWLGPQCELQADCFYSNLTTTAIEDQTDIWGFPYSLTSDEQARLKSEWFPGDGTGYMHLRFPLGFAYRGLRNIDGTSGKAKNIGERFAGQNASITNMLSNVSAAGGGLFPEYWSPAPHWKQSESYSNKATGKPGLWAGAAYARTVSLDSIRVSDPTQYAAQIDLIAAAMVDDLEYLHANVAPVRGFSLANEPFNTATAAYGHCEYPADGVLYVDLFTAVRTKILASTALATYDGQPNTVLLFGASWTEGPAALVNSPLYDHFIAHTLHYITNLYTDGDVAKTSMTSWKNATLNLKPIADNEFEYFADPGNDPWQFSNTALVQAHFVHLGGAPFHNPMIHVIKPLGQTFGNVTKGYAVVKARLPAPFNQAPTTPGDADPTLDHGHYEAQGYNANAVKAFSDNMPPGSIVYPHAYSQSVAGTQMVAFKTAAGKVGVVFVNRTAGALPLSFGLAGVRDMKVKKYDKDTAGTLVERRITSALTFSVPAYTAYVAIEQ